MRWRCLQRSDCEVAELFGIALSKAEPVASRGGRVTGRYTSRTTRTRHAQNAKTDVSLTHLAPWNTTTMGPVLHPETTMKSQSVPECWVGSPQEFWRYAHRWPTRSPLQICKRLGRTSRSNAGSVTRHGGHRTSPALHVTPKTRKPTSRCRILHHGTPPRWERVLHPETTIKASPYRHN
jgi:hypothetical protein